MTPDQILHPTPEGLYCPPGGFHIDPVRPVAKALIRQHLEGKVELKPVDPAPIEVPEMQSMGMCMASSSRSTLMWAMPRAPPPPSATPMRGRPSGDAARARHGG